MLFDVVDQPLIHQVQPLEPRSTASLLLATSGLHALLRGVRNLRSFRSHRPLSGSVSNRGSVDLLVLRFVFLFLNFLFLYLLFFRNLLQSDLLLRALHDALPEVHALFEHGADVLDLRVGHFECQD